MLHQLVDPTHQQQQGLLRQYPFQQHHPRNLDTPKLHSSPLLPNSSSSSPAFQAALPPRPPTISPTILPVIYFQEFVEQHSTNPSLSHLTPLSRDMSAMLEPPSPLLLNPTIVASQSSSQQQSKPQDAPPTLLYHQHFHHLQDHEGMVHPHHQHQLLQPQPQQQLHHHRSVMQLQQQYNNMAVQDVGEGERGQASDATVQAFYRKRSHSVPLLQLQALAASSSSSSSSSQEQRQGQGGQEQGHGQGGGAGGGNDDDDQDMEGAEDDGVATITALTSELMSEGQAVTRATVYDYSQLALPRESLLATLPRPHRHHDYAAGLPSDSCLTSSQQPHPQVLYYTLPTQTQQQPTLRYSRNNFNQYHHHNHHHHHHRHGGSSLHRDNQYIRNRFPPHHHWPNSAQRDFHLATIGTLNINGPSLINGSSTRSGLLSPASVLGTDAVLRSNLGSAGVNKGTTYKSRLPVHLRHMTSRTNRRAAICVNPFQSDQNVSQQQQLYQQLQKQQQTNLLRPVTPSCTATSPSLSTAATTSGSDFLDSIPVLSPRPLTPITTFNAANVAAAAALETMNQRKGPSDWKRVSASIYDLDENDPRRRIMRLNQGGGTVYSTGSSSTGLLGSSVSSGSSNSGGIRNRLWMNQRGGLVNLTHQLQGPAGTSTKSTNSGRPPQGRMTSGAAPTSTVDRLVEEMNKWSV